MNTSNIINNHAYVLVSGKLVGWALAHKFMSFILPLTT